MTSVLCVRCLSLCIDLPRCGRIVWSRRSTRPLVAVLDQVM